MAQKAELKAAYDTFGALEATERAKAERLRAEGPQQVAEYLPPVRTVVKRGGFPTGLDGSSSVEEKLEAAHGGARLRRVAM